MSQMRKPHPHAAIHAALTALLGIAIVATLAWIYIDAQDAARRQRDSIPTPSPECYPLCLHTDNVSPAVWEAAGWRPLSDDQQRAREEGRVALLTGVRLALGRELVASDYTPDMEARDWSLCYMLAGTVTYVSCPDGYQVML